MLVGVQGISCCKLIQDRRSQLSNIIWHMFCSTSASLSGGPTPMPLTGATVNTTSLPWKCAISLCTCQMQKQTCYRIGSRHWIHTVLLQHHPRNTWLLPILFNHSQENEDHTHNKNSQLSQLSTKLGELTSFTYQLRVTGAQSADALHVPIWNTFHFILPLNCFLKRKYCGLVH